MNNIAIFQWAKIYKTIRIMTGKLSKILLFIGCALFLIVSFLGLSYNLDSIYDEGYLFLSLQSIQDGNIIGMSQANNIIYSVLGNGICGNIYQLRVAGWIFKLVTAFLFCIITYSTFDRKSTSLFEYCVLCLLMVLPRMNDIILCHNGLAQFFLCIAFALGYRILVMDSRWNILVGVLVGVSILFAIFCILPASILLLAGLIVLIVVRWKKVLWHIISLGVGLAVGLLLMHVCVVDITKVFQAMKEVAGVVTTLDRGYDVTSFAINILLFARDWGFCLVWMVGMIVLSTFLKKTCSKYIGGALFVIALLVYSHYQEIPRLTLPMMMSIMWLSLLYNNYVEKANKSINIDFQLLLNISLILSPVILSIGTNVYLGTKMAFFMLPWALLLYRLKWYENKVNLKLEVSVLIMILFCLQAYNTITTIDKNYYKVSDGILRGMHLTDKQYNHFEQCQTIMTEYDFIPKKSVIYTTQIGMMTVCYLDGVNCGLYFQPMDFVANADKDNLLTPDFLFLTDFDIEYSGQKLSEMQWGWPEDFEVYNIGTPEKEGVGFNTNRKLFCRKKSIE